MPNRGDPIPVNVILKRYIGHLRFIQGQRKTNFVKQHSEIQPVTSVDKVRHKHTGVVEGANAYVYLQETNEIYEIISAVVVARTGVAVANRTLTMRMSPGLYDDITAAALSHYWDSNLGGAGDSVVLSANQYGFIYYDFKNGFGSTNDNGVLGATAIAPREFHIGRGFSTNTQGQISAHIDNYQGDEQCSCAVFYRRVGDTFGVNDSP